MPFTYNLFYYNSAQYKIIARLKVTKHATNHLRIQIFARLDVSQQRVLCLISTVVQVGPYVTPCV